MTDDRSELLDLPNELIFQIFSYIPFRDVILKLSLVCSRFNSIISDELYWKCRSKSNIQYADCETKQKGFNIVQKLVRFLKEKERWSSWENQKTINATGHTATVDCLKLFKMNEKVFCISASRDRSIRLWNIENAMNPGTYEFTDNAHNGWIWNLAKGPDHNFYTSSWDSYVKKWSIDVSGITQVSSIGVGSAAHCVSCVGENEIVCTTFAKRVAIIDNRNFEIVNEHKFHKSAVISLATDDNFIYTGSEDRALILVDRRNMKKPVLINSLTDSYCSYLSLKNNQLLASTSDGYVNLYNTKNLNLLQSFKVGTFTRQAIIEDGAYFVMAKQDRTFEFKVFSPGIKSELLCISNDLVTEPAKFDYEPSRQILAIGNGDSTIRFCISNV